jgi:HEAT repeat protein
MLKNILYCFIIVFTFYGCSSIDQAESLYRQGENEKALEMALNFLNKDDSKIRLRAVRLVGKVGGEKAGSALRMRIMDPDSKVQKEVIKNLGKLKYEPAMEDLVDLVPESDEGLIRAIGGAFANYGEPGIDMLVERYEDPSEKSNRRAFKQTLILVGPNVAPSIIKNLRGKSFFENRDSFDILQKVKNPKTARMMLPYLKNEEVAEQVIEATVKLGSSAVNAAIDALNAMDSKNEDIRVREGLIKILGELKDPRAVESLEGLSQHSSERIRDAVDQALFKIRGF